MDSDKAKFLIYQRLYASTEDLLLAKQYAHFLLKKGWHSSPWERRGSIYMQQSAFTTALVVSYGRPFTRSKGWPDFPKSLLMLSDAQSVLHSKLLGLRHEVYAHSDSCRFKIKPVRNFEGAAFDVVGKPFRKLEKHECEGVLEITAVILAGVCEEMDRLRPFLLTRF